MATATIRITAGGRDYTGVLDPHLALALRGAITEHNSQGKSCGIELATATVQGEEIRSFNAWVLIGPSTNLVIEFPQDFAPKEDITEVREAMVDSFASGHTLSIPDSLTPGDY